MESDGVLSTCRRQITEFTYPFLNSEFVIFFTVRLTLDWKDQATSTDENWRKKLKLTSENRWVSGIFFEPMKKGGQEMFHSFQEICLRWLKWRSGSSLEFEALFLLEDAHWQCKVTMLWYCYYHWKSVKRRNWYLPCMPYMLTTNSTVSIGVRRTFRVPLNVLSCTARSIVV